MGKHTVLGTSSLIFRLDHESPIQRAWWNVFLDNRDSHGRGDSAPSTPNHADETEGGLAGDERGLRWSLANSAPLAPRERLWAVISRMDHVARGPIR